MKSSTTEEYSTFCFPLSVNNNDWSIQAHKSNPIATQKTIEALLLVYYKSEANYLSILPPEIIVELFKYVASLNTDRSIEGFMTGSKFTKALLQEILKNTQQQSVMNYSTACNLAQFKIVAQKVEHAKYDSIQAITEEIQEIIESTTSMINKRALKGVFEAFKENCKDCISTLLQKYFKYSNCWKAIATEDFCSEFVQQVLGKLQKKQYCTMIEFYSDIASFIKSAPKYDERPIASAFLYLLLQLDNFKP